jgi:hypothetical protein
MSQYFFFTFRLLFPGNRKHIHLVYSSALRAVFRFSSIRGRCSGCWPTCSDRNIDQVLTLSQARNMTLHSARTRCHFRASFACYFPTALSVKVCSASSTREHWTKSDRPTILTHFCYFILKRSNKTLFFSENQMFVETVVSVLCSNFGLPYSELPPTIRWIL